MSSKPGAIQSDQPGVLIKDVAESLCIHPLFMLSKWRKQVRDGELVGKVEPVKQQEVTELRRFGPAVRTSAP